MLRTNTHTNAVLVHTSCPHAKGERIDRFGETVCRQCGVSLDARTGTGTRTLSSAGRWIA